MTIIKEIITDQSHWCISVDVVSINTENGLNINM